jgi:uncharacterized Zn finger protein
MEHSRLTVDAVRDHCGDESFRHGRDYANDGAVERLRWIGDVLEALVQGKQYDPYTVHVTFLNDRIVQSTCSCPIGRGCKHVAAALLDYSDSGDDVEQVPDLAALLAALNRDQLQSILVKLAHGDREMYDNIADLVNTAQIRAIAEGHSVPVAAPFQAAARSALTRDNMLSHKYNRSYDDYGEFNAAEELHPILVEIEALVDSGQTAAALSALEAVTGELLDAWDFLDDDDFDSVLDSFRDAHDELDTLWSKAVLSGALSPAERTQWTGKFSAMTESFPDDTFECALNALVHEWDNPIIRKMLAGGDVGEDAHDLESRDLYETRLHVLEAQGRSEEALNFALAVGFPIGVCKALIALGRPGEATDYAISHLSTRVALLEVCRALWDAGAQEGALRVGESGLDLKDDIKYPYAGVAALPEWVRDSAQESGRPDLALRAADVCFDIAPSLADYGLIRELSGDLWSGKKVALLQRLKDPRYSSSAAVDIFLLEELWDDALDAAENCHRSGVLEGALRAVMVHRPERVIQIASGQAESIMNSGAARNYEYAVDWLMYARAAYETEGTLASWRVYVQDLLVTHRRKYKLVPLLLAMDDATWPLK